MLADSAVSPPFFLCNLSASLLKSGVMGFLPVLLQRPYLKAPHR